MSKNTYTETWTRPKKQKGKKKHTIRDFRKGKPDKRDIS